MSEGPVLRTRWTGQWLLCSEALAPTCSYPFFPKTQCPPFFSPAASRSDSGPRFTFPLSQEQVPLPASAPSPNTHNVLVLLRDGAARWGTSQSLKPHRQRGGSHGPVAASEAGPAVCTTADPVAGVWPMTRYHEGKLTCHPSPPLLLVLLLSVLGVTSQGGASMLL